MTPVASSTWYTSPKVFSMNTIRFPSCDQSARSPNQVTRLIQFGRWSAGLSPSLGRVWFSAATLSSLHSIVPNNRTIHNDINPRHRVRGPGLQELVGRVPSRGGTFGVMFNFLAVCRNLRRTHGSRLETTTHRHLPPGALLPPGPMESNFPRISFSHAPRR